MTNEDSLRDWVREHLATVTGMTADGISLERKLSDYGLDSVDAILMAGELEDHFSLEIDPAAFIQFETFEAMVSGLSKALEKKT